MGVIGIIILLIIAITLYMLYKNSKEELEKHYQEQQKKEEIVESCEELNLKYENLLNNIRILTEQEHEKRKSVNELTDLTNNMNERAAAAFEQYVDALEVHYKEKENEFEKEIELLDNSYDMAQSQYIIETEKVRTQLENLKATHAAAIEAQRQEKIIKENKDKFRLNISDTQRNDVLVLERVKKELSNPRILSMLIWQTYFRDYMTELCNYILGNKTICGIYKITNQITDECYIGQSVDIGKRWKDHAKCGLDIDRPQGNKLYQAMIEDGIWNFTFELLEECPREKLNEKEKYFIELYQADAFGYNSTGGNR